jgi:hypothetical protein
MAANGLIAPGKPVCPVIRLPYLLIEKSEKWDRAPLQPLNAWHWRH